MLELNIERAAARGRLMKKVCLQCWVDWESDVVESKSNGGQDGRINFSKKRALLFAQLSPEVNFCCCLSAFPPLWRISGSALAPTLPFSLVTPQLSSQQLTCSLIKAAPRSGLYFSAA